MMWLIRMALRNARRNTTRTLVTAGMVVIGTALLVVALTWIDGMFGDVTRTSADSMGHARVVDPEYARREALMPLYHNIEDVQPVLEAVRAVPQVQEAWPRIAAPAAITAGEEIGEVFAMLVGGEEPWLRERMHLEEHLVAGTWLTGGEHDVLLGRILALQLGVEVGDEVRMLGQTQDGAISPLLGRVTGILSAGNALIDQQVFLTIDRMEWMVDLEGGAIEVLAYADHHDHGPELAEILRGLPELQPYEVQAWTTRPPWDAFHGVVTVMRTFLVAFFVGLAALGVLNTMMMSVIERTSEIGVLRAMGLSRVGAVALFVFEGLVIAVLGGVVGVAIGSMGGLYLSQVGIPLGDLGQEMELPVSAVMRGHLTVDMMLTGFVMALMMSLLGTLLPAFRAAAIQPVTAMRSGR